MTLRVRLNRVTYADFLAAVGWDKKTNTEIRELLQVTPQQQSFYKNQEGYISMEVVLWCILTGRIDPGSVKSLMVTEAP